MKSSPRRILMIILMGAALACSFVLVLSESGYVTSISREAFYEGTPRGHVMLPALTSHEEAIDLANSFLRKTLGDQFFQNRFTFVRIEERPELSVTWFVVYEYLSNDYTVEMKIAVNAGRIPEDRPRIHVEFSYVILEPQEILISEEQAKVIARENGLEPPYNITLFCRAELHRIYWKIVRRNSEDLRVGELVGVIIDAESGTVLDAWRRQYQP
jgi:hypothetical protein